MNRVLSFFISFCVLISCFIVYSAFDVSALGTSAEAFVLIDADTGVVLTQHQSHKRMKPASTTKILTTLLSLEYARKDNKVVTFTKDMIAEGSSMYLKVGDKVRLTDLAAGMMMASGNDAANAVALTLSDSFEGFSKLMNNRAKEIGMVDTNFVTASGLDNENHYTTAYDMALLMAEAMKNQSFLSLTSCKSKTVDFVYPESRVVTYNNHNRLLSLYDSCTGGKTGFTKAAGRCLVTSSEKNGIRLVAVTFNAPDDWNDHISLYEYGFSLYSRVELDDRDKVFKLKVAGGEKDTLTASGDESVTLNIPSDKVALIERKVYLMPFVFAPVNKGDTVGRITYILEGTEIAKVDLSASESVTETKRPSFFERLFSIVFSRE